jgi:hypothetical protein
VAQDWNDLGPIPGSKTATAAAAAAAVMLAVRLGLQQQQQQQQQQPPLDRFLHDAHSALTQPCSHLTLPVLNPVLDTLLNPAGSRSAAGHPSTAEAGRQQAAHHSAAGQERQRQEQHTEQPAG